MRDLGLCCRRSYWCSRRRRRRRRRLPPTPPAGLLPPLRAAVPQKKAEKCDVVAENGDTVEVHYVVSSWQGEHPR